MRTISPIHYCKYILSLITCLLSLLSYASNESLLPEGFVYLHDIEPSIIQEIRYASYHNFVGRPLSGYHKPVCILTKEAATALQKVQKKLLRQGYSLKVYDCYRPQTAVNDIKIWSKKKQEQSMKKEFFPRENKADFFKKGYVAAYSGHSRGSTVDLTIIKTNQQEQEIYYKSQPLVACYANYRQRFRDNSIDFGTGFDCLDKTARYHYPGISKQAYHNRKFFRHSMQQAGFKPYPKEWWHFTLKKEPFKHYFDFPVQ